MRDWMKMRAKLMVPAGLTVLLLAGCETPQTGTQAVLNPPEQTIHASPELVRSAAVAVMVERGYILTPLGSDTLLFDRAADMGSTLRVGVLYNKAAWRRVRIRLYPDSSGTRVTAEPALVTNRGDAFEQEEADHSGSAREALRDILEKIQAEAMAR